MSLIFFFLQELQPYLDSVLRSPNPTFLTETVNGGMKSRSQFCSFCVELKYKLLVDAHNISQSLEGPILFLRIIDNISTASYAQKRCFLLCSEQSVYNLHTSVQYEHVRFSAYIGKRGKSFEIEQAIISLLMKTHISEFLSHKKVRHIHILTIFSPGQIAQRTEYLCFYMRILTMVNIYFDFVLMNMHQCSLSLRRKIVLVYFFVMNIKDYKTTV